LVRVGGSTLDLVDRLIAQGYANLLTTSCALKAFLVGVDDVQE
jgi:hypothetical protein